MNALEILLRGGSVDEVEEINQRRKQLEAQFDEEAAAEGFAERRMNKYRLKYSRKR